MFSSMTLINESVDKVEAGGVTSSQKMALIRYEELYDCEYLKR